ncbi:MAG TPA: hypothetical protein VGC87_01665 [Pyrinomonadaceae bacterium]|jgi:hypothetical protein
MFEFLSQASTEQATASIHYATRLIRHVKYLRGAKDGLRVKDLKSEPSADDESLANRIISEIETKEQSSLAELDNVKAEEYIQALADILQSLLKDNLKYDEGRGEKLLGELREDKSYASPYQSVRRLSNFSSKTVRWISGCALLVSLLIFLYGIDIAQELKGFYRQLQNNPTMIEGVIAVLNIVLAFYVLLDSRIFRPVSLSDENSPASNSFRQLLLGWRLLWFTWILFYGCLAAQWLHLIGGVTSEILGHVSELLNMINGFFFYYLFFVLDQPSVPTAADPERANPFRRNCVFTFLLGIIIYDLSIFLLWNSSVGGGKALLPKLVPAYIAVGMAFFFGRLDSHYLKLPRIILAPLYLYAVIQLFWEHNTFANNKTFIPERVTIFSVALILKFVVFLTLSKLIRHERFRQYFVIAEKGLREN